MKTTVNDAWYQGQLAAQMLRQRIKELIIQKHINRILRREAKKAEKLYE